MLSRFFINRPIFASVLSIIIVLGGAMAIFTLPVAQYPEITPPGVQVTAAYPGANPEVIADTVAAPIEQEVNGVEGMLYMGSKSSADGVYKLDITFGLGTDPDMATVLVQNRVQRALAKLPPEVQRQGVSTKKVSTSYILIFSVFSPDERYDDLYIANYVTIRLKDEISRIRGVGDIAIFPEKDYSMRIWLDPNHLESRKLTTNDVLNALQQQNVQVAAGVVGQEPAPGKPSYELIVDTRGRLSDVKEFQEIIVKTGEGGRHTRLKDVARVNMGGKKYTNSSLFNGKPGATVIVYQSPGSNALEVTGSVRAKMDALKKEFPPGLDYRMIFDISSFINASVHEVQKTLVEAFILVFIVVFVFLQDWRSTVIPAITIPVSLIGTFAVMKLMGFSINMVTLFGLVLAIGIVVDDAIIVVENVERNMVHLGLSAKDAAFRAMEEITGPIVGVTLVLMAVFLPAALLGGITGQMYRQFSLTIAVTTLFSAINALTLSPALCALWMRPHHGQKNVFFRGFNNAFDRVTAGYGKIVGLAIRRVAVMMLLFAALLVATWMGFKGVPTGFIPIEDDGLLLVNVQLPDAASMNRTQAVMQEVGRKLGETDGITAWASISGFSLISGSQSNAATLFCTLQPWDERLSRGRSRDLIIGELADQFARIQDAVVFPFTNPAIPGLGTGGGFEMQVQDREGLGFQALDQASDELAAAASQNPQLTSVGSSFSATTPRLFADLDRVKALTMGVRLQDIFDAMQAYLGAAYVNDFNKFGRTWQVNVQAESRFRMHGDDIKRLQVRSKDGKMVPLGTLLKVEKTFGPVTVDRYNLYPSAKLIGQPAEGFSSGQALSLMESLAKATLPVGMGYEWTAMSYQEKRAGGQAVVVFAMAILVVFLILSAQYESWADPFAVILVVPLAVLGAVAALLARGMDNNLYTQVGLVLLVGLAAKNAILVVEFARDEKSKGRDVLDAALEGARMRLRPILMTSFAFILGVLPLVLASGAGAVSRQAVGTAVCFGMLGVTALGIFFTPVFYVLMQKISSRGFRVGQASRLQSKGSDPP